MREKQGLATRDYYVLFILKRDLHLVAKSGVAKAGYTHAHLATISQSMLATIGRVHACRNMQIASICSPVHKVGCDRLHFILVITTHKHLHHSVRLLRRKIPLPGTTVRHDSITPQVLTGSNNCHQVSSEWLKNNL